MKVGSRALAIGTNTTKLSIRQMIFSFCTNTFDNFTNMYSLPKWAMLSTGQSRAGACPGYFAKAGSVLREGELDDDYDDDDDGNDDDDERECDPVDGLGRFCQGWLCPQGRWTGRASKKVSRLGLVTSQLYVQQKSLGKIIGILEHHGNFLQGHLSGHIATLSNQVKRATDLNALHGLVHTTWPC